MKPLIAKSLCLLFAAGLLCLAQTLAHAQPEGFDDLAKLPKLGRVHSVHSLGESHLAVWYWSNKEDRMKTDGNILVIYEIKKGEFTEVFRYIGDVVEGWHKITPLCDSRLLGVVVESGVITSYDGATIFALVDGKFQQVFQGSTSDVRDLNEDGIPELFESSWPDGDGYPTSTTVHFWNGKTYKPLMKVAYRRRFGPTVQSALVKKRVPR